MEETNMGIFKTAAFALTSITFAQSSFAQQKQNIIIGGGSVTGVYYQVALNVCNILNKKASKSFNCVGRPSLGSVFNINAVSRGLLDFGVAQSDRNWQAWNGKADWEGKKSTKLRSVFSVHPETVLLVVRKSSKIKHVKDLKGKVINIGNAGSGQRGNAMDILKLYGLNHKSDLKSQGLQQNEASRAIIDKKIDGFFYTVGNPAAAIQDPANSTDIDIVNIDSQAVKKFVKERPYYVMSTIPKNTYKGVSHPVTTYAVKATVVTSADATEKNVYEMVKTFFTNLKDFQKSHAAFANIEPKQMLEGLSAPLHPGAKKYYKEQGWLK